MLELQIPQFCFSFDSPRRPPSAGLAVLRWGLAVQDRGSPSIGRPHRSQHTLPPDLTATRNRFLCFGQHYIFCCFGHLTIVGLSFLWSLWFFICLLGRLRTGSNSESGSKIWSQFSREGSGRIILPIFFYRLQWWILLQNLVWISKSLLEEENATTLALSLSTSTQICSGQLRIEHE